MASRRRRPEKNNKKRSRATTTASKFNNRVLYYPDVLNRQRDPFCGGASDDGNNAVDDPSGAFFELANVPWVGYRITPAAAVTTGGEEGCHLSAAAVVVRQDNSVREHTGGIVWETSYLLAAFLIERYGRRRGGERASHSHNRHPLGKVLEIGSGCGMLGLVLAASGLADKVVLTETTEVLDDLRANVDRNVLDDGHGRNEGHDGRDCADDDGAIIVPPFRPCLVRDQVAAHRLRWDELEADVVGDLRKHSFDTIVGTDVVFCVHLVEPLLRCLAAMSHRRTLIYLCLQVRCVDSHEALLRLAPSFGLHVVDCTGELRDAGPTCSWGIKMECKLLRFVVKKQQKKNKKKKDKSSSKKNKVKGKMKGRSGEKRTKDGGAAKDRSKRRRKDRC